MITETADRCRICNTCLYIWPTSSTTWPKMGLNAPRFRDGYTYLSLQAHCWGMQACPQAPALPDSCLWKKNLDNNFQGHQHTNTAEVPKTEVTVKPSKFSKAAWNSFPPCVILWMQTPLKKCACARCGILFCVYSCLVCTKKQQHKTSPWFLSLAFTLNTSFKQENIK